MIHFLVDDSTDLERLDSWDPDAEPKEFVGSVGHNILELRQRLLQRGRMTTIGAAIPEDATLVVLMPQWIIRCDLRERLRWAWSMRRHRVVVVRSDLRADLVRRFRADLEVAPNQAFIDRYGGRGRCVLPPLPQRGLLARDPSRGDRISAVTLKTCRENIPPQLIEPSMVERLDALGITLDIDSPATTEAADQDWNDFTAVDVAICARGDGLETITKPATKLLNAWAAGVIPLASHEPAYDEIGTDRLDVLFFDGVDEVPELLRRLQEDAELRSRLWRGVADAAAAQPTVDELVDAWWELFRQNERPPSRWREVRSIVYMLGAEIRGLPARMRHRAGSRPRRRARAVRSAA